MQHTWLIPEVSDPVPRGRARTRRCGKIPAPLRDPHGDLYSNLNKVNNDFLRGAMRWAHPSRKRRPQHRLTPGPCCNAAGDGDYRTRTGTRRRCYQPASCWFRDGGLGRERTWNPALSSQGSRRRPRRGAAFKPPQAPVRCQPSDVPQGTLRTLRVEQLGPLMARLSVSG